MTDGDLEDIEIQFQADYIIHYGSPELRKELITKIDGLYQLEVFEKYERNQGRVLGSNVLGFG